MCAGPHGFGADDGDAIAAPGSVTDEAAMAAIVDRTLDRFGQVDILVNNAGILRDKSFAKMSLEDFRLVLDVHVMGAANATHAVWRTMQAQGHGRSFSMKRKALK